MPISTAIWRVAAKPERLEPSSLAKEQMLEDMIVADPRLLSDDWMLIGRQENTPFGGRTDLLGIEPDGSLVLIEIKRDRTPREVVAQALDYASWVKKLKPEEIAAMYGRFAPGRNLTEDFHSRFKQELDDETLNKGHQIIIVASGLDESSERIVSYLSEWKLPINVLCFQVFDHGTEQLLTRTWLLDPVKTQSSTGEASGPNEPWNGEVYCSFGEYGQRSWEDAREFGFISAGGGPWYSKTLNLLNVNDRIWVNAPPVGYVGVGRVKGPMQSSTAFKVQTTSGEVPILNAARRASYHRESIDDPTMCEYFVPVEWLQTFPLTQAVKETGLFGNQNTVCKPTTPKWSYTVERLKARFPSFGG